MIYRFESEEGNPRIIRYRQLTSAGVPLVQSGVSSLKLFVYDTAAGTATTPDGGVTLTVSQCVYNSLQAWEVDDTGYNVAIPVSGQYLPNAATYRVEVQVTPPSGGEPYYLRHSEITCVETYSS